VCAAGKAAQVKALVNMVMNINIRGLPRDWAWARPWDSISTMLREVFSQTGANSASCKPMARDMQKRDHSCFFSAAHAAKDSGIALRLSKEQGLNLPLATATKKTISTKMVAEGLGELDKSGIRRTDLQRPPRGQNSANRRPPAATHFRTKALRPGMKSSRQKIVRWPAARAPSGANG